MVKLVDDADPQVRMQLTYTLGEWDDPQAGTALGRLALEADGDRFVLGAVMSSVNKRNLDSMLMTVLTGGPDSSPPVALADNLLRLANAVGDSKTFVALLHKVSTPRNGRYAPWQFGALAGLLDALDQRNSSLAKLQREGDEEVKATVRQLGALFAAARETASNSQTSPAERLQAIRLLGREANHQQEDLDALANLLIPQTPPELQSGVIASLGRLREPGVPEHLLRGWKGYGPALRAQALDVLLSREEWLRPLLDALERQQVPSLRDRCRTPPALIAT
jgi:hypothetical protein